MTANNQISKFIDFLTDGYNEPNFWELRLINKEGRVKQYFFKNIEKMKKFFGKDFLEKWNCYMGILPRIRKEGNADAVMGGNVFVVDLDSQDAIEKAGEIYKRLHELNLRPSLIVNSGHGLHVYYKLEENVDVTRWKKIQEKFLLFFKKHFPEFKPDMQLKDPSRLMRVIGTLNLKDEKPIESCFVVEDYSTYSLESVEEVLREEKIETEETKILRQTYPRKQIPKWLENVINQGVPEGERNHWRFVIALNLRKRGFEEEEIKEIIRKFNECCRPPEEESVVERHLKVIVRDADKFLETYPDVNINDFNSIIKLYEEEKKIEPLPVVWDADLKNLKPSEVKFFVDYLIPESSIVMLAGKRSSYKSWAAIHIALALAAGEKVFGKFSTKKATVLYIDEENGIDELQRRVRKIKQGMGLNGDLPNLCFLSFENLKIEQKTDRRRLENFLAEHNPCIIIVDCFRRIISAEENDATAMNEVFSYIRELSKNCNVTWVLLHHLRKGISGRKPDDVLDELRGSSEITNVAESVIVFERPPRVDNRFILRHSKARRSKTVEPLIIELRWDDTADLLKFECMGTAEEVIDSIDLCMRAIMIWIEENNVNEFTTKEVMEAVKGSGYSRATVYRSLAILEQQGKVLRVKRGRYRKVGEKISNYINEVSKYQMSPETNSKEDNDSINSIKVKGADTSDTNVSLNSLNNINSETIDTKRLNQKCHRCGSNYSLTQVEDYITHKPLWVCQKCVEASTNV